MYEKGQTNVNKLLHKRAENKLKKKKIKLIPFGIKTKIFARNFG